AVGKNTAAFYISKSKALAKCQDALLKGKVGSCPDEKNQAAIDKAEAKKVDAITAACCGADGVCDQGTCHAGSPTPFVCQGGANNGHVCTTASACPGGGTCVDASNESRCYGGTNDRRLCQGASSCPGGTCVTGPAQCEAPVECGRCQGGTDPG